MGKIRIEIDDVSGEMKINMPVRQYRQLQATMTVLQGLGKFRFSEQLSGGVEETLAGMEKVLAMVTSPASDAEDEQEEQTGEGVGAGHAGLEDDSPADDGLTEGEGTVDDGGLEVGGDETEPAAEGEELEAGGELAEGELEPDAEEEPAEEPEPAPAPAPKLRTPMKQQPAPAPAAAVGTLSEKRAAMIAKFNANKKK